MHPVNDAVVSHVKTLPGVTVCPVLLTRCNCIRIVTERREEREFDRRREEEGQDFIKNQESNIAFRFVGA